MLFIRTQNIGGVYIAFGDLFEFTILRLFMLSLFLSIPSLTEVRVALGTYYLITVMYNHCNVALVYN